MPAPPKLMRWCAAAGRTTWSRHGRWCAPARRGWCPSTTVDTPTSAIQRRAPHGCRRWLCAPPARHCRPRRQCWCRCRGAATSRRWPAHGAGRLRAAEDTLRRWMAAAALVRPRDSGGVVVVVAESSVPTVQSLIRWDPVGHAEAELAARTEVALPPSVHMAALDGPGEAVTGLLEEIRLPDSSELLGPVPLPVGARRPPGLAAEVPVSRMLVRARREQGVAVAADCRRGLAVPSARKVHEPVRVQIDPLHIG